MNKQQIKAELIRSACEDERPAIQMELLAFMAFDKWLRWCNYNDRGYIINNQYYIDNHYRTLILLCAESLHD